MDLELKYFLESLNLSCTSDLVVATAHHRIVAIGGSICSSPGTKNLPTDWNRDKTYYSIKYEINATAYILLATVFDNTMDIWFKLIGAVPTMKIVMIDTTNMSSLDQNFHTMNEISQNLQDNLILPVLKVAGGPEYDDASGKRTAQEVVLSVKVRVLDYATAETESLTSNSSSAGDTVTEREGRVAIVQRYACSLPIQRKSVSSTDSFERPCEEYFNNSSDDSASSLFSSPIKKTPERITSQSLGPNSTTEKNREEKC